MYVILSVLILLLFLVIIGEYKTIYNHNNYQLAEKFKEIDSNKSPCNDKLSDIEYLTHMIPHHIVAIDISYVLQKNSRNSVMQDILRNLIWTQEYEVTIMNSILDQLIPNIRQVTPSNNHIYTTFNRRYISTVANFTNPNKLGYTNVFCDPNFFNVKNHREHIKSMPHKIDEIMYIKHMIPHHQVAVDMSKRLLKYTNNTFMMELAYRIARNQEKEIIFLSDMLKNKSWLKNNNSKLL